MNDRQPSPSAANENSNRDLALEVDVAVLGAGPIGLDAALALSASGRSFAVLERGSAPGAGIRSWGEVQLFSPWSMNLSPRMRDCLRHRNGSAAELASPDRCPTGDEFCDHALDPIAASTELSPHLHFDTTAIAVGREELLKREEIGTPRRGQQRFRLLLETPAGERLLYAQTVLDCTGNQHHPLWLGASGIPAPGERSLAQSSDPRLIRSLSSFMEQPADSWDGQRVLLVGGGHSAQTAALALAETTAHVLWAIRGDQDQGAFAVIADDPLPERSSLQHRAGALLDGSNRKFEAFYNTTVDALQPADDTGDSTDERQPRGDVLVTLRHLDSRAPSGEAGAESPPAHRADNQPKTSTHRVDRIVSLVGAVGDHLLYRELQVQECYATSGPMRLAAALLGEADPDNAGDCLAQVSQGPETLITPEPGYFILGNKSYGRNNAFLLRVGYDQVNDVMELVSSN